MEFSQKTQTICEKTLFQGALDLTDISGGGEMLVGIFCTFDDRQSLFHRS